MKNEVTIEEDKFRIILHQEKSEHVSTTIDARTSKNGSLTVGGYDLGPFVKKVWGKYDYEYDATIAAEDKNILYAILQKELFNNSHDEFKSWLDYVDNYLSVWVMGYEKGDNLIDHLVAPPGHELFPR